MRMFKKASQIMKTDSKMKEEQKKRNQKALKHFVKRTEEEKAEDPERKIYKGLREKLKRARRERD